MTTSSGNRSLLLRAVLALTLLAGFGLAAWLWSTPSLNASSLSSLAFTSPIGSPQLSLNKSVDNSAPAPGDQINYLLSYSNTQPSTQAFNLQLYDFLPAGAQLISTNPPATIYPNGVLLFTAPSIGSQTITATVRVRVPEGHTQLVNHALVTADNVTPTVTSLLTNIARPSSDMLRLTKSGPPAVPINGLLVYTLQATNLGSVVLADVNVIDVLPTGVAFNSAAPAPGASSLPMLRWSLGNLNPAETRTIVVTTTAPSAPGLITNSAIASAFQNVMTQTLFATQVITNAAILDVVKTGSAATVNVGGTLVYTLSYQNLGNQTATTVRLTDTLPAGVTVNGTSQPPVSQSAQQLVWDIGTLSAGQHGQIIITTTVGSPWGRTLINLAYITGQPGSFGRHTELQTTVPFVKIYLPLMLKNTSS